MSAGWVDDIGLTMAKSDAISAYEETKEHPPMALTPFADEKIPASEDSKMSNRKIMIMPGDGIGPEVMDATMKVADWFAKHRTFSFDTMLDYVVVFPMKSMECPSLMKRWLMSCHVMRFSLVQQVITAMITCLLS